MRFSCSHITEIQHFSLQVYFSNGAQVKQISILVVYTYILVVYTYSDVSNDNNMNCHAFTPVSHCM